MPTTTENSICVVHLVRASNGAQPLMRFIQSYKQHRAGIRHTLLYVLKGFDERIPSEFEVLLHELPHKRLRVPDIGYDITSYFRAMDAVSEEMVCFLNSFSEILADEWLLKLHTAALLPGAGAVGATGSYQGTHANRNLARAVARLIGQPAWIQWMLRLPFVAALNMLRHSLTFARFPNPHLRTNAFMLRRSTMQSLHPQTTRSKYRAYAFESGRNSLTRQILKMGKSVYLVGRNGVAYGMGDWRESKTFWTNGQENLLVSDNQTQRYLAADSGGRELYSRLAWGPGTH